MFLLALVGYLFFIEFPQEKKNQETEDQTQRLISAEEEKLHSLQLISPEQETHLKKEKDGKWMILQPIRAETDERVIQQLLSTLFLMKQTRVLENVNGDPSDFGFDFPQLKIHLNYETDESQEKETLTFGDEGPIFNTLFVKRGSDGQIILMEKGVIHTLSKSLFDLRNKKVLPVNQSQVTQLELIFNERHFIFKKDQDSWLIQEPREIKADKGKINDILFDLESLRALGFVDSQEEKTLMQESLKIPDLKIIINEEDATFTVSLYKHKQEDKYIALTSKEKPLYELSDSGLTQLTPDIFLYQDKHLLNFEKDQVSQIKVFTHEESYQLEKKEDQWVLNGQRDEINTVSVTNFLLFLKNLEAQNLPESSVNLDEAGLRPPLVKVELNDSKKKSLGTLLMGRVLGEEIYVKGIKDLGVALVRKSEKEEIPLKNELIKKEENKEGQSLPKD